MFKLLISVFQVNCRTRTLPEIFVIRNVIGLLPSLTKRINGISVGIANTPDRYKQTINGLSCELMGAGYVTPFLFLASDDEGYLSGTHNKLKINGLIFGPTLFSGRINGIFLSGIIGTNYDLSGVSFSLINATLYRADGLMLGVCTLSGILNGLQAGLYNSARVAHGLQLGLLNLSQERSRGLQIGLINLAGRHRGLQIGLWNKNQKRSLPLINW